MGIDNLASTPYRSAKPGEIITFGTYPQSAEGVDRSPILWRALQNSGRELFMLSEYIFGLQAVSRRMRGY